MCVATPMQVLRMQGGVAMCAGPQGEEAVDVLLTGALAPGQWVMVFLGAAREVIDAARASEVNAALTALQGLMQGGGDDAALIAAGFADLVDRQPQLPEHLRRQGEAGGE